MPKFLVSVDETLFYLSEEIEAVDENEAEEKYMDMIGNGDVLVNKSEYDEIKVSKVKQSADTTKMKIELTKKELETVLYHLRYDIESIYESHDWKEIGLDEKASKSVLVKLEKVKSLNEKVK